MTPAQIPGSDAGALATGGAAAARNAATVVILRETAGRLEALLLQRPATASFAAGEWVFPGGSLEAEDCRARSLALVHGADARMLSALRCEALGARLDAELALGLCFAACRETFEESGILLARHRSGAPCSGEPLRLAQHERLTGAHTPATFCGLLERHDLVVASDALVYFSNWLTPLSAPRRFDARFFITHLPPEQAVADRLFEVEVARWLPVEDRPGGPEVEPPITAPPTLLTLRELALLYAREGSLARLLDAARALDPAVVMLKIVKRTGGLEALFPWDEEYAAAAGTGVPCGHALSQRLGRFPSRIPVRVPRGAP